jgi:hypothetical protein
MRLAVVMLVLTAATAAAAPVPREPMPDPLGRGLLRRLVAKPDVA